MFQRPKPAKASPPSYYFNCVRCHRPILVEPNQCGSRLDCMCGAANMVPSLMNLQRADAQPTGSPFAPKSQEPPQQLLGQSLCCPFCSRPMEPGRILGNTYRLKWLRADIPLALGIWALGGIGLGRGGQPTFIRPHLFGWRCAPCGKLILDERA
ncbi:MAG: hypothetical protein IAF94_21660 [Pirellulaceae bacterium]|nr:hypothetical protein [Pirellulaceae bacterium]